MCGIVGALDLKGNRVFPLHIIQKMTSALFHRGPDQEGIFSEPGCAMGVRRLILRDPVGGNQPMKNSEAYFSLNGELYSFYEDKNRLEQKGVVFESKSDTEVFFNGVLKEGISFLEQAEAQFAIAYYKRQNHSLLLARDRFGISPLYYTQINDWLLWASEAKAIFASGMVTPKLNPITVDHILTQLAQRPGESCFEGIHSIPPGHFLKIENSEISLKAYHNPNDLSSKKFNYTLPSSKSALIDKLEKLLLDAIYVRLEADAEIGTYLSGGVDSSLITAMATKIILPKNIDQITAYSIQLGKVPQKGEESIYAVDTAKNLGIRHIVVPITPEDIVEKFPAAVWAAEVPVLDHANICLLELANRVRSDGKKAVLTGEGADEAFGGYPWQKVTSSCLPTSIILKVFQYFMNCFSTQLTLSKTSIFQKFSHYPMFATLASIRKLFYSKSFLEILENSNELPFPILTTDSNKKSILQRSLLLDYQWLLAGHLLIDKGDRVSMAASVEARYPYLDESIVHFASLLPDSWKIKGFTNKWILRAVAEKYLKPEAAWRKKHLFRAEPVIHSKYRPKWVDQLLSPESIRKTNLFDPNLVQKCLEHRLNPPKFSLQSSFIEVGLSGIVSTQLLHHLFCGGNLCDLRSQGS